MSETKPVSSGNHEMIIIAAVIAVIIVGAGSFYGGMAYAGSKRTAGAFGQGNFAGRGQGTVAGAVGARVGAQGGGLVNGDIISLDDKSITIKSRDNSSKIVFFSSSTEVGKFVSGAISDLTVGESLMVTGKSNSDGSVTAQSIQIRPAGAPAMQGGSNGVQPPAAVATPQR